MEPSGVGEGASLTPAAKANPGALNQGSAGVGSIAHPTTELLGDTAKVKMTHVPCKGASNAAIELAAGQIQVIVSNYSTVAPLIRSGKNRPLAVTSAKPHPAFADLPPLATVAPGFNVDIWVGVFAPAGTPAAIVERLNQKINAIAASPELAPVLEPDGTLPEAISPAAFSARLNSGSGSRSLPNTRSSHSSCSQSPLPRGGIALGRSCPPRAGTAVARQRYAATLGVAGACSVRTPANLTNSTGERT
jgi:tripartite-type tricarboxylate transporter receptor subunit TctC